jgi:PAS domain S-box-containing protein
MTNTRSPPVAREQSHPLRSGLTWYVALVGLLLLAILFIQIRVKQITEEQRRNSSDLVSKLDCFDNLTLTVSLLIQEHQNIRVVPTFKERYLSLQRTATLAGRLRDGQAKLRSMRSSATEEVAIAGTSGTLDRMVRLSQRMVESVHRGGLPGDADLLEFRAGGELARSLVMTLREQSAKTASAVAEAEYRRLIRYVIGALAVFFIFVLYLARSTFARILAEQALKESKAQLLASRDQLATTFQSIGDAIVATDAVGRIVRMNPVAEKLTGWSQAEAHTRAFDDTFCLVREETRRRITSPVGEILHDGRGASLADHLVLIARDGTECPVASSGAPIRDKDGQVTGTVLVFRDQTAERAAERALRQSEERFRTIFDSVNDAIIVQDETTGAILDVNARMCQMFGCSHEQALHLTIRDLSADHRPENGRQEEIDWLARAAAGQTDLFEWRWRTLSGQTFWGEVNMKRAVVGAQERLLVTVRDVSERRRLESQLAQAHRLETIGQLAGGVAHDFNNLMTPVMVYSEMLMNRLHRSDERFEWVRLINDTARRASTLTRQLLAFSRREVIQPRPLDINDEIMELDKILSRLIREDIHFEFRLAPDLGVVEADPMHLQQILMNLVLNAQDALPDGGTITLETSNQELDERYTKDHPDVVPGRYVMLSVSDDGVGIVPENLKYVFEPYFTTKEVGKGTGLGLAMVYGHVKQHNGHITVESTPGVTTTFRIYLPRSDQTPAPAPVAKHEENTTAATAETTILVVEDDDMVRNLICRLLSQTRFKVLSAAGPHEGLRVARQCEHPVTLLLTDVVMPGMSGAQLYEALRSLFPQLKAVYMSGYTADAIGHHGVLDGGIHFLPKPFTSQALMKTLLDCLSGAPAQLDPARPPGSDRPLG